MADSTSQTLAKRNSEMALMPPPPPPPKRQKRPAQVLDEDVYSDALSRIIARDFFPGLAETEAQKEYVEALDSTNKDWIREAGRKLTQVMTPGPGTRRRMAAGTNFTPVRTVGISETPRGFVDETPGRTPVNDDHVAPEHERPEVDINMSLGAFQAKYTSEDNESFNALLDRQNESRAARYGFFQTGNKIPSARQIAYRKQEQRLLEQGHSTSSALATTNAAGEQRIAITSARPSEDLDLRPASVESFPKRQGPRNHFMFCPEGVEDQLFTSVQQSNERSIAPPKAVNYGGTRFNGAAPEPENIVPHSPSVSAIDAAIAGRARATGSELGYNGAETPRVNGYAFVDAEPTPNELGVPVTDQDADAAEQEAIKQLLPKLDDSGPNLFNIKERSKREDLHHRLVEKADASRRKAGRIDQLRSFGITPRRTPTPKFASGANIRRSAGNMTPAARALADKIGTPRRESSMFGASKAAKDTWIPTPRTRRPV